MVNIQMHFGLSGKVEEPQTISFHVRDNKFPLTCMKKMTECIRDVSTGATGMTGVAPKFSGSLTLFQPGVHIQPTISAIAPKFSLWLRPCVSLVTLRVFKRLSAY